MNVGSLVMTCPDTDYACVGIVVGITDPDRHNLWYSSRIIHVLNSHTGEELKWAEEALKLLR